MSDEVYAAIIEQNDIEAVWDIQCSAVEKFGFDRLIYGYSNFTTGSTLGDMADAVILTRHDREYVEKFIGDQLYKKGPMMKWAAENVGAISWSYLHQMVAKGKLSEDEMEMMTLNMSMQVMAGFTMSFHSPSIRSKGALALCAKRGLTQKEVDEIWDEHGEDIQLIAKISHIKITQLPNMNMRRPLTPRQQEVLQWVAEGKGIRDVAEIMGLNPATVEKHLRLARLALNVETTAQAVHKAAEQNQFFLVEH